MIRIITDPDHLIQAEQANLIAVIADYSKAYEQILEAIQFQKNLTLYVQHNTVIQWFQNMAGRYPQGLFTFETIEARHRLEQLWQISVPPSVSNTDIMRAGLLEMDPPAQPGLPFADVILAHFYAPLFTVKAFPFSQLSALLNSVDQKRWQHNAGVPLLVRTYQEKLKTWREQAKTSEQRQLIDLFGSNPHILYEKLTRYKVLHSYKDLGHALLGDLFDLFEALNLNRVDLEVDETQLQDVVTQVSYVLNGYSIQSKEDVETLIAGLSGALVIEFETVEKHLVKHPEWISDKILAALENKFEALSRRLERRIVALRSQIKPEKPEDPNLSWNIEQMLDWATQKYLPYQTWCNEQDQLGPELYQMGEQFAEWLFNNWHSIHANSQRMVFNVLPNKAVELKQAGRVNLIIVVDNLGWSFSQKLKGLFQQKGFYLSAAEPYLAMLPSETEISKKCLLSGAVGYASIDNNSYKAITEKGWVPYFNDAKFRYISDIGGLDQIEKIDVTTYVVNYLAIDKALHMSSNQIGMPHVQHIQHLLEKLVERVDDFVERHNLKNSLHIYIVSDHGSIRIPAEINNDLDVSYFKASGFSAPSHRYIAATSKKFTELPENLRTDCFFLNATDYGNEQHYLCARRANRFLPADRDIYVHGGLSPEEVVVPCMVFEAAKAIIQNLTLIPRKTEFRYRLETVEIEIGNPNDTAVENIQVFALNSNIEMEPQTIQWLNGKTKTVLQFKAQLKQTLNPEEQTSFAMRIRFTCQGEKHTNDTKFKIVMHKMVEEKGKSVFDDLD